jgi:hypothetical protein
MTNPTNNPPGPSVERPAEPGEVCSCGRPAVVVFITRQYGDVPYCGAEHAAPANPAPAGDGRIADARAALTAASVAVMSGNLGYDAERVVERLTAAVEELLALIAVRAERGTEAGR